MLIERRSRIRGSEKNIVVLYHGDCSDGFGGAWAAWKKFGKKAEYIGLFRGNHYPSGLRGKELYFIDFVYSPEITKELVGANKKVIGLDHHVTGKASVGLMAEGSVYSENHSGAVVAWKYFHPKKKVPMLLRYVEDRDIWKWALPASKEISAIMDTFTFDFRFWDKAAREFEKNSSRKKYVEHGRVLKKYQDFLVKKLAGTAELVKLGKHKILAVNASHEFASELGHLLAVRRAPFGLVWSQDGIGTRVGLRSDGTVDVAKIAQKYGGGGHKAAAGFMIPAGKKIPWKPIKKR
ncbi:MAG: DHHA1 domain-containing protein [Candidatus Liptonbacteria bacterium]|nr:DHHA1 domain-containing protein [Candidatus Liptonbacteria bacterium]